ncbi:fatty acid desaturase [Litorimonas sp. RW-G-Af-16]|uniref:fatty acid desaturase n=1 Tax=Litorimonas sp. RW-G-Af-16 TaxID=3241168 RepID=UPI00390CA907
MAKASTTSPINLGPLYAVMVASAWLTVHIYSIFFHQLSAQLWQTIGLIALQCWLYTGLFIIAHDTMHGSLVPNNAKANAFIGTAIMFVYAGFNWRAMRDAHHAHHDYSGTEDDPDFNAANPNAFWPWYFKFFLTYFGWRQVLVLFGFTVTYILLGASYINTIIMWAVPAILSSVQLFYFGTYLTHRHKGEFIDQHNARTNNFPRWLSLLTCFHFGYHHEHHLYPHEPWWRLPARKFAK